MPRQNELRQEPLQVVDQALFVGKKGFDIQPLQLNPPLQAANEPLRLRRELIKPLPQERKRIEYVRIVNFYLLRKKDDLVELFAYVVERRRLQFAWLPERLLEHRQRRFRRLPRRRHLIQVPDPPKVIHRQHFRSVGMRLQIPPRH